MEPNFPEPLDLQKLKVYPLSERKSLTRVQEILLEPGDEPRELATAQMDHIERCANAIVAARRRNAGVMLIYGAHLIRNGAGLILEQMMSRDWLTDLATNGAGTIHDWEYAATSLSTESVEDNVHSGHLERGPKRGAIFTWRFMRAGFVGKGMGARSAGSSWKMGPRFQ